LLPEFSWIEGEEFSIESIYCSRLIHHRQRFSGRVSAAARS
jgi:hypothetical protein